jgi:replicative superfamily II helicase
MMSQMLNLGLLEEELGNLRLSMLGRACGESSLSFVSAMRLVELVRSASTSITATDLMALVQALPESDNGWTPMMRRGTKENIRASQAAQRFSPQIIRLLQRHVDDTWDYYARCKRAAILADWIKGVLVEVIEKEYSTTPYQGRIGYGDIRRFADNTRFHLRAAHKITNVLFLTEGPSYELIDELLRQLEEGLPADALDLLTLPVELDRGSKLALYNAGIRTANVLWKLTDQEITRLLGSGPARALITRRPSPKDDA